MIRVWAARISTLLLLSGPLGCASLDSHPPAVDPSQPTLPAKHQVRAGQCVFLSDAPLKNDHPLLKELEALQEQICKELQLPSSRTLVFVYLFADRPTYETYMHAHFKNLPHRRAYFMARTDERSGDELMVYTYWGDRTQEDLRHELTHATLHSVLKNVPLWLDEGLAEFFEVPPDWQGINYRHLAALRSQPGIPWTPDLGRLERLTLVKDMTPAEYRESWAWVHFMLRSSPQAKGVLITYLQELRSNKNPGPLGQRLAAVFPSTETALRQHITHLEAAARAAAPITP